MTNSTEEFIDTNMTNITGIGARLKNAREAMKLSEKEAAAKLHLSVKFIHVMEEEDFANGPPATFMRGYLRSYANLLNFSQKEINAAIEKLGMNTPAASIISPILQTPVPYDIDRYVRWSTYLIILILLVLVGIWWNSRAPETVVNHPAPPPSHAPKPVPQAPRAVAPASVMQTPEPFSTPTNNMPHPASSVNNIAPPPPAAPVAAVMPPTQETPVLIMATPELTGTDSATSSSKSTVEKPTPSRKRHKTHMNMSIPEPGLF